MRITQDIALSIVQRLQAMVDYNINIMDENGIIVASSDPKRIDSIHEGALEVLCKEKQVIISAMDTDKFHGTKPGVNLPIEFMGKIVGVVGITGDSRELAQLAKMVKITVELMVEQAYVQKQLQYKQHMIHSWIMELITYETINEEKLIYYAKHFLNVDVTTNRAVILLEIFDRYVPIKIEDVVKRNEIKSELFSQLQFMFQKTEALLTFIEEHIIFISIPLANNRDDEQSVGNRILRSIQQKYSEHFYFHIGIGNKYKHLSGIKNSFSEAKQCLSLMKKLQSQSAISHINSWGITRFLDKLPATVREELLKEYPIHKLTDELFNTLQAVFDCDHNLAAAAKKLHIHRNTLSYRLRNIQQLLQLNPKSINDAAIILILIILYNLEKTK